MPYGDDITEAIPLTLSNPNSAITYAGGQESYDVAFNGQAFFLAPNDQIPYRRVTAKYRKDQYDTTREPGEQSLTGWWLRSQSSFHSGAGIKFFEPAQDESLRFQFTESKGVNIWTRGQVTLLNDVDEEHQVTGLLRSNGRPNQYTRSITWTKDGSTYDGVLMVDEYDVDKLFPQVSASIVTKSLTANVATLTTNGNHGLCTGMEVTVTGVDATFNGTYTITSIPSTTTFTYAKTATNVASTAVSPAGTVVSNAIHFIDYNAGSDDPVYAICDDGTYAYWVTNDTASGKLEVNKKLLSDPASVAPTVMFTSPGITVTNAVMEYTKERIVMAANNKIYEFSTAASTLPTAVYTHPVDNFVYTSITSSGAAIYVAGYAGVQSNIQKFILSTAGAMPTLSSAITAAEMPSGEQIYRIYYYLGYMMIGTSQGVRAAVVSDTDGSIAYGPLIFESSQPCYDFAARDKYVWCATSVDGEPGLVRIDLGNDIGSLSFAYTNDVYKTGVTNHLTTACSFIGATARIAFTASANSTEDGNIYMESADQVVESGYLRTGFVRYNTLEGKIFKLLQARVDNTDGGLQISSIDYRDNEYNIGSFAQGDFVPEISIPYPQGSQEYLGFKFTLNRGTNTAYGPTFTGYQLKALPAIPRQRLIQYPVFCYDHEQDNFNVQVGYDGRAYDRMTALESVENAGDTIRVDDFRTGESFVGLIEEMDFMNSTPSDKRFTGFGGILLVTLRSVS